MQHLRVSYGIPEDLLRYMAVASTHMVLSVLGVKEDHKIWFVEVENAKGLVVEENKLSPENQ